MRLPPLAMAIALACAACTGASSVAPAPSATEAAPEPEPEATAIAAPADGWVAATSSTCLPELTLTIPPETQLRELRFDRCIASVQDASGVLVNIERSTRSASEVAAQLSLSHGSEATQEPLPNGWIVQLADGSVIYAHRDDLGITCMSLRGEAERTSRICRDARRATSP